MSEEVKKEPVEIVSELEKQYKTKISEDEKDLKAWIIKEENPEVRKAQEEKIEKDIKKEFEQVRSDFDQFKKSQLYTETTSAGKEFFGNLTSMIVEGWEYGFSKIVQVEPFKSLDEIAKKEIASLRNNEQVKDFVLEAEEKIDLFNRNLFSRIDEFFHGEDQLPAKIYTFDDEKTDPNDKNKES